MLWVDPFRLGRKRGRLRLGQLGELAGGVDYAAVAQAATRFGKRLERERALRGTMKTLKHELPKV